MEDGRKFTRKQFLVTLGSMILTAAVAKVTSMEGTLTAIADPKRANVYGGSVYGGQR